jgi:hypothetical protein
MADKGVRFEGLKLRGVGMLYHYLDSSLSPALRYVRAYRDTAPLCCVVLLVGSRNTNIICPDMSRIRQWETSVQRFC